MAESQEEVEEGVVGVEEVREVVSEEEAEGVKENQLL